MLHLCKISSLCHCQLTLTGNIPARPNTSHTSDVTKSPTSSPHPYNLPRPSTTSTSGMMARHRSLRPPTVRKSLLKPPKSNSLRPSAPKQDSTIWADDDEVYWFFLIVKLFSLLTKNFFIKIIFIRTKLFRLPLI